MRIVITGASGNVGTALLRRLGRDGHELVGVTRRQPPQVEPYAGVRWVRLDIAEPTAKARLADECHGADALVHLAWLIQPSRDRERLRRVNQDGTATVANAVQAAGVPHLVHMSSVGTYARAPRGAWMDETWPATGVASSSYSVDKAAAEQIVDKVPDTVTVARVRPALILQAEAASEISRYFLGRLVPVSLLHPALFRFAPWPRELHLQFVHAEDVAAALALILEQRAGGAFNLAAQPPIDREEARRIFGGIAPPVPLQLVRGAVDLSWRARLQPVDAGWVDLGTSVPLMLADRARQELGWQPQHRADETLQEFLRALQRREGHPGPLLYPRRLIRRSPTGSNAR